MKINLNLNLVWFLHKARLVFLVGIFYVLYVYTDPLWSFMWALYFILNDLSEIVNDVEVLKDEKDERTQFIKSMSTKRKGF